MLIVFCKGRCAPETVGPESLGATWSRIKTASVSNPWTIRFNERVGIDGLADNDNFDDERRLMYVAITRAERS